MTAGSEPRAEFCDKIPDEAEPRGESRGESHEESCDRCLLEDTVRRLVRGEGDGEGWSFGDAFVPGERRRRGAADPGEAADDEEQLVCGPPEPPREEAKSSDVEGGPEESEESEVDGRVQVETDQEDSDGTRALHSSASLGKEDAVNCAWKARSSARRRCRGLLFPQPIFASLRIGWDGRVPHERRDF